MSTDTAVNARFDKKTPSVTVSKTGDGVGTVTSNIGGINCGATCTENYALNTSVILIPTPADQFSEFAGWSGDCSGTGSCTLQVDRARSAVAEFRKVRKTATVSTSGAGAGSVTSSPSGIACGTDCTENYLLGTVVALTAVPHDSSSEFDHWTGACSGSGVCNITMSDSRDVGAVFRIAQKMLSVVKAGDGSGTITSTPAGVSCGTDCSEPYNYGSLVSLAQVQSVGYFTGWTGACSGDKDCTVTMDAAKTVTGTFDVVSVDGDYCQQNGVNIFCFFVRSNAVVQTALGTSQNGTSTTCRSNFYSGNSIADQSFNVTNGDIQLNGNFESAYRISGHYNGSAYPCTAAISNDFNYEVARPNPNGVSSSSFGRYPTYDPNFKNRN
jgi:hypothetical protein